MMSPNAGSAGRSKTMVVSGSALRERAREAKNRFVAGSGASGVKARPAALKAVARVARGALTAVPTASDRLTRLRQILGPSLPQPPVPPNRGDGANQVQKEKQLPVAGLGKSIAKATEMST